MRSARPVLFLFLVFLVFAFASGTAAAQDPVKVGPHIYKLVFENERVRVSEIKFKPGEKIATHSHPDHFAYVMGPGKLRISKPDGTSNDVDFKVGEVLWIPAETHSAVNTGNSEVRALIVELKEPPKAAKKM